MKKNLSLLSILALYLCLTTASSGITYLRLNGVSTLEINPPAEITVDADLASSGNQLLFEIYLDVDSDGLIDADDQIVEFIYVNDGIPPIGEENEQIPGDEDKTLDAKIKMMDSIPAITPHAQYICRGTDENGSMAYATLIIGQAGSPSPPYIYGTVRDSITGEPLEAIYVVADDTVGVATEGFTITDQDGYYIIPVTPAVWQVGAFDYWGHYRPDSQLVEISGTETKEVDFDMAPYNSFIEGRVDSSGVGVPNIIVMGVPEGKKDMISYELISSFNISFISNFNIFILSGYPNVYII